VIIVAGYLHVDAAGRDAYLDGCRAVVEQARAADGCLDFALSPDLLDARRINVFERWATEADLARFRGSGPSGEQSAQIQDADVQEFRVEG
jgi:quinol monooxygenase YgiN